MSEELKYYLVVAGPDNAFVVEAFYYNTYEGWPTFIGEDGRIVASLSPGGNFYFKELTQEEHDDMLDELGDEDSHEEDSEPGETTPSFQEYLRQARADAKPIYKED